MWLKKILQGYYLLRHPTTVPSMFAMSVFSPNKNSIITTVVLFHRKNMPVRRKSKKKWPVRVFLSPEHTSNNP